MKLIGNAPQVLAGSWLTWVCYAEKWVVREPPLSSVLPGGLPEIQTGILMDIIAGSKNNQPHMVLL